MAITEFTDTTPNQRRLELRAERAVAAPYRAGLEPRIIVTYLLFSVAWTSVLVLGIRGDISLWAGLVVNTILASTFYMPLHEAAHGNIHGDTAGSRWWEDLIGMSCSIPVGISYKAHRTSHMRHHAFTNDPQRDPDHYTAGPLKALPYKWFSVAVVASLLPLFVFVPVVARILPAQIRDSLVEDNDRREGIRMFRFWVITHLVLVATIPLGVFLPALLLWYLPSRLQTFWLLLVFAWFPHHPATDIARYADTRVAVFPGSTFLLRGHDHHALHHLFPRVPHYRLKALWQEIGADMTAKGVRTEGRASGERQPIVW
jgi:fatty acid desaturase